MQSAASSERAAEGGGSQRGENLPPANGGDAKCGESEQAAESLNEESTTVSLGESFDDPLGATTQVQHLQIAVSCSLVMKKIISGPPWPKTSNARCCT